MLGIYVCRISGFWALGSLLSVEEPRKNKENNPFSTLITKSLFFFWFGRGWGAALKQVAVPDLGFRVQSSRLRG